MLVREIDYVERRPRQVAPDSYWHGARGNRGNRGQRMSAATNRCSSLSCKQASNLLVDEEDCAIGWKTDSDSVGATSSHDVGTYHSTGK
jgi:hypothetical protein